MEIKLNEKKIKVSRINKKLFSKLTVGVLSFVIAATPLTASAATFSDIPDDAWYKSTVDYATSIGAIEGYADNTFRPNSKITYGEFIKMTIQPLMPKDYESNGFDESIHWAMKVCEWAIEVGIIKDEDGFLGKLNLNIPREDMAKILVDVYQYINGDIIIKQGIENNIPDLHYATNEAQQQIKAAYSAGLIAGKGNVFAPENETIRAEAATVAARITNSSYRLQVSIANPKVMNEAQVKAESIKLIKDIEFDLKYVKDNLPYLSAVYNDNSYLNKEVNELSKQMSTSLNSALEEQKDRNTSNKNSLQPSIDDMQKEKNKIDRIERFVNKTKLMVDNGNFESRKNEISQQLVQEKNKKFTKQEDLNILKSLATKSQTLKMDFVKAFSNCTFLKNNTKSLLKTLSDIAKKFNVANDKFIQDNNSFEKSERPSSGGGSRNNANPPQQGSGNTDGNGQTNGGGFEQDSSNPPAKDPPAKDPQAPTTPTTPSDGGDRVEISYIDKSGKVLVLVAKNNIYTSNINC